MKIRPVGAGILVKVQREEKVSKGGIILTDPTNVQLQAKEVGVVLEMGTECFEPPYGNGTKRCEVGDKIIFKRYAGITPNDSDTFMRIIQDTDVIALIEE